jgi:hypothetical protein
MENSISYCAGGKRFEFATPLAFGSFSNELIARKVFLEVNEDRGARLLQGKIPLSLSIEEEKRMSDAEILDWYRTTDIVFVDYFSKKKLSMHYMSDFINNFRVELLHD